MFWINLQPKTRNLLNFRGFRVFSEFSVFQSISKNKNFLICWINLQKKIIICQHSRILFFRNFCVFSEFITQVRSIRHQIASVAFQKNGSISLHGEGKMKTTGHLTVTICWTSNIYSCFQNCCNQRPPWVAAYVV